MKQRGKNSHTLSNYDITYYLISIGRLRFEVVVTSGGGEVGFAAVGELLGLLALVPLGSVLPLLHLQVTFSLSNIIFFTHNLYYFDLLCIKTSHRRS